MQETTLNPSLNQATVESFLNALNNENFEEAGEMLAEDFKFIGVMGSVDGRQNYVDQMSEMKFKYDIIKLIHDEENVSGLYNVDMSGKKILVSGWYEIKNGLIQTYQVVFDPTPLHGKE